MKNLVKSILAITLVTIIFSCRKDDSPEMDSNCYVCTVETETLDVCIKDDGDFSVDGETVPNPSKASLEDYITAIESNPENDPALEGISCKRK